MESACWWLLRGWLWLAAGTGWRRARGGTLHRPKTQNINAGRVPPPPFMGNRKQGHGGVAVATVAEPVQRSRVEHELTFPLYTHTFHLLGPILTYT